MLRVSASVIVVALIHVILSALSYAAQSKMERWYTLWNIGYGQNGYPLELEEFLDDMNVELLKAITLVVTVDQTTETNEYWFSVSEEEQGRRFKQRISDPTRRWKLSGMDLEARTHWVDYSRDKDDMFRHTDIKQAPWYVVDANDKRRARLNCISHLLSMTPYKNVLPNKLKLPPMQQDDSYVRPPVDDQTFVPEGFTSESAEHRCLQCSRPFADGRV